MHGAERGKQEHNHFLERVKLHMLYSAPDSIIQANNQIISKKKVQIANETRDGTKKGMKRKAKKRG